MSLKKKDKGRTYLKLYVKNVKKSYKLFFIVLSEGSANFKSCLKIKISGLPTALKNVRIYLITQMLKNIEHKSS